MPCIDKLSTANKACCILIYYSGIRVVLREGIIVVRVNLRNILDNQTIKTECCSLLGKVLVFPVNVEVEIIIIVLIPCM